MTLAEAIHALAITGSRLAGAPGGITLVVPEGATVDRQVLEVLRAHREQLAAIVGPSAASVEEKEKPPGGETDAAASTSSTARGDDLAEYLAEKSITGSAAELVLHAAQAFNVRTDRITVEAEGGPAVETGPTFFEPGVPCLTTIDTEWHEAGVGLVTVPAGTLALAIPQTWAIANPDEQSGIEATLDSLRRHKKPMHVPVWLNGKARAIEHSLITFEGAVAPHGMNLLPWRPTPRRSPQQ